MTERSAKRTAGVTRITHDPLTYPVDLPDVDLNDFTLPQLRRVALDRGLLDTGTADEVRERIETDMAADFDITEA